jgi:hypothetical protein
MELTKGDRAAALKAAITAALDVVPRNHDALETLSLARLAHLAFAEYAASPALEPMRGYLKSLPGLQDARLDGGDLPASAVEYHNYVSMTALGGRAGNESALGTSSSVVISSILPVSPTDDELRGKA